MPRYLISRVLYTLPVIWLVVSTVFLLIHFVPGDPIQQMLGEGAAAGDIQAARHAYGLDVPLGEQYLNYWKGVLHGDLGKSLRFNQGVTSLIAKMCIRDSHTLDCSSFPPPAIPAASLRRKLRSPGHNGAPDAPGLQDFGFSSSITLCISSLASVRCFMMSCTSMTGLPGQRWLWQ